MSDDQHTIRCAHCKKSHRTVAEVLSCSKVEASQESVLANEVYKSAAPQEMTDGIWKIGDIIYKVIYNKASGDGRRLYAKMLVKTFRPDGKTLLSASWHYTPGAMRDLALKGKKLTLDEAKEFGHLYGICCNCLRDLTNETSIELGIGPVCRTKFAA